ncbi:PTS glucose transporter subunit IIA [Lactiplantibacillus garii]|uniref:PTS glucose transporter subunit IIA n=1 Tax=Lactiplantibacillus garii TaxID=2306423 RepID=A0A3R8J6S2_9LACO|nr:PTS glucose transporter subunit IIA [Lactiplantibacillus garii]RRK10173.1 PTS glucose transporter subunit IIA [Lactiplantibacillus garii]
MFGFKKKQTAVALKAIANGQLMPITAVADEVFSQKMMGDGFAIEPTTGTITAPADGEIKTIADTKHAVMLTTPDGLELMLHLGLDTVELKGAPFDVKVQVGERVTAGQPLVQMDLAAVKAAGKQTTVIMVITNMDHVDQLTVTAPTTVTPADDAATVTVKA